MQARKTHRVHKTKELLRLETFSDGVFAIVITLLVLEVIQVLHTDRHDALLQLLLRNWKAFVVFFIAFMTILICWINHHLVLSYIERTDSKLFWVNGFVLLVVTVTPFPTAILAEYLERESHLALAIFGFNYLMMSVAAFSISAYIYHHLLGKQHREIFYYHKLLYKYSIIYTLAVFFICFVSVPAAILLYVLLFLVFAFPMEFSLFLLHRKHKRRVRISRRSVHRLRS